MAKLYFHYSTMNAGKSTMLLQAAHNYAERGMSTVLLTARLDHRAGEATIASRIGIAQAAQTYGPDTNLYVFMITHLADLARTDQDAPRCILLDEAQFLTPEQVWQLARIVDDLSITVMAYGLRVDFLGNLFPGSQTLLALSDEIREVRTIMLVRLQGDDGGACQRGRTRRDRRRAGGDRRQ